jgi:hypothetical protein
VLVVPRSRTERVLKTGVPVAARPGGARKGFVVRLARVPRLRGGVKREVGE